MYYFKMKKGARVFLYQSIQFKVLLYIVNCAFCYYLCYSEISGLKYTMHAGILKPAFSDYVSCKEEHEGIFRDVLHFAFGEETQT
jgi:hypothetical protein